MRTDQYVQSCLWPVVLAMLLAFEVHPAKAQIVIGDEALPANQLLATEPLVGYRKVSDQFFASIPDSARGRIWTQREPPIKTGIPVDVFIASAKTFPDIQDHVAATGRKDPSHGTTIQDWYQASSKTVQLTKIPYAKPTTTEIHVAGHPVTVDPNLIASLPETEVFTSHGPKTYDMQLHNQTVKGLEVDPKAFTTFANAYSTLAEAEHLSLTEAQHRFNDADAALSSLPALAKAAQLTTGEVTFGKPIVLSAKDKKLEIPPSITAKGDIYCRH